MICFSSKRKKEMSSALKIPDRYPLLFTCGPLHTSRTVKEAMLVDYGSRDQQFVNCIEEIRSEMLRIGHVTNKTWACVPMQGPGTMGLEASALTVTPPGGRYLLINTGKYAERQGDMAKHLGFQTTIYNVPETSPIDLQEFENFLAGVSRKFSAKLTDGSDASAASCFHTIGIVHHETSTGMVNPVESLFPLCRKYCPNAVVLLDAISSFGGMEIPCDKVCDVLILSSNKCFHSIPGFSCCLIRRELLQKGGKKNNNSKSFTLDLARQCQGLDKTGQFPFTPPVHAMLAFRQAIREFNESGGVAGRIQRYKTNSLTLRRGMAKLGFQLLLKDDADVEGHKNSFFGHMLVSFLMPKDHPNWNFALFYKGLKARGFIIYPGKASKADAFRYACMGDLYPDDCERIVGATAEVMKEMGLELNKNYKKNLSKL